MIWLDASLLTLSVYVSVLVYFLILSGQPVLGSDSSSNSLPQYRDYVPLLRK